MNDWLCLRTTTGREFALAQTLNQLGAISYAPRLQVKKKVYNHTTIILKPFFPAYLFTDSIAYQDLQPRIKQLPIVLKSWRVGVVEGELIDLLRQREDEEGYIIQTKESLPFQRNDTVVVNSNAFRDIEAIFLEHYPARDRIKLLVPFMGSQREVTFNYSDIQLSRPIYA